ncbi:hypothetical protein ONE63_005980 [Megalurothrips usitatus]|uniref:Uncharacterized protein n=1 Tax=Megalurothrips usitatus TaxID=439358 RepID=A0AAV7XVZ6_9NEOP|nr:hypothetical protein ONE63_005980 [Megalurothrips usitatus]
MVLTGLGGPGWARVPNVLGVITRPPHKPSRGSAAKGSVLLLQLYDRIASQPLSPSKPPPSDAVQRARDVLDAVGAADADDHLHGHHHHHHHHHHHQRARMEREELRDILSRPHFRVSSACGACGACGARGKPARGTRRGSGCLPTRAPRPALTAGAVSEAALHGSVVFCASLSPTVVGCVLSGAPENR